MEWIADSNAWIALVSLTALEIVLGIDNIIFISIISGRLPESKQRRARSIGLFLAMLMRILLLFSLNWVMSLTKPLFSLLNELISGRDLILLLGGLFLLAKATFEIHEKLEGDNENPGTKKIYPSFMGILIQIMLLDIVFSLDSVITAIGMAEQIQIMVLAVVIAVIIMMVSMNSVSTFVEKHPTIKILALSFLLLIGVSLIAEGLDFHISKGYIYFAMSFSLFVEMLNLRFRSKRKEPIKLRKSL